MVQKAFGIYGDDLSGCSLFIETGSDYIACCSMDIEHKQLRALELFNFDEKEFADFEKLFLHVKLHSRLLSENTGAVQLVWANDKAVCVPAVYFSEELVPSLFEAMHGITGEILYSISHMDDIVVVGYIPAKAAGIYAETFNISHNSHKYFSLLNMQKSGVNQHSVYVVFNHNSFIYSVYKENTLQLIQKQQYKTSEDVLYHLLNALTVFEMPVDETEVTANGMIDDSSPLFKNLYTYFNHFGFPKNDGSVFAAEGFKEYPLHYFASFCQ